MNVKYMPVMRKRIFFDTGGIGYEYRFLVLRSNKCLYPQIWTSITSSWPTLLNVAKVSGLNFNRIKEQNVKLTDKWTDALAFATEFAKDYVCNDYEDWSVGALPIDLDKDSIYDISEKECYEGREQARTFRTLTSKKAK